MMKPAPSPVPVWLGFAGLLPFWGLALCHVTGIGFGAPASGISLALACYAATILSFLGGIRWGIALAQEDQPHAASDYILSVLPQLAGWAALALPDPWRFAALAILLIGLGPFDRRLVRRGLAPDWFGTLRLRLSLGAGAALFLAALEHVRV